MGAECVTAFNREYEHAKHLLASELNIDAPCNDHGWTALQMAVEHYAINAVLFVQFCGMECRD